MRLKSTGLREGEEIDRAMCYTGDPTQWEKEQVVYLMLGSWELEGEESLYPETHTDLSRPGRRITSKSPNTGLWSDIVML